MMFNLLKRALQDWSSSLHVNSAQELETKSESQNLMLLLFSGIVLDNRRQEALWDFLHSTYNRHNNIYMSVTSVLTYSNRHLWWLLYVKSSH